MADASSTWRGRAILHVDMDAFFAAIEQLDHPEWRGRPVIVGGSPEGRGVVSTASYEARASGVRSAIPAAQAARLCPDAVWARPRFERYREISDAVMALLDEMSPYVEPVSIDEAYLDVTPTERRSSNPVDVARRIMAGVDAMGLSCSIGVASSKTVAKIASDRKKPHGITVVRPGEEAAFLAPLPVRMLPGIGGATAARLRGVGVRTLGELADLDPRSAESLLGSGGPSLVARAAGVDDRPVGMGGGVKSVSHEHTFAHDIREQREVAAALGDLVARVALRLRRKGLAGRTLTVKVRYADFTTKTTSITLAVPTDLDSDLLEPALDLLRRAWSPGAGLRLIGFGVSGFGQPREQMGLFDEMPAEVRRHARALIESIDAVRERFGDDAIGFGHVEQDDAED